MQSPQPPSSQPPISYSQQPPSTPGSQSYGGGTVALAAAPQPASPWAMSPPAPLGPAPPTSSGGFDPFAPAPAPPFPAATPSDPFSQPQQYGHQSAPPSTPHHQVPGGFGSPDGYQQPAPANNGFGSPAPPSAGQQNMGYGAPSPAAGSNDPFSGGFGAQPPNVAVEDNPFASYDNSLLSDSPAAPEPMPEPAPQPVVESHGPPPPASPPPPTENRMVVHESQQQKDSENVRNPFSTEIARRERPPGASPLPKADLVRKRGYVLSRISFRTIVMKKWKQAYWVQVCQSWSHLPTWNDICVLLFLCLHCT